MAQIYLRIKLQIPYIHIHMYVCMDLRLCVSLVKNFTQRTYKHKITLITLAAAAAEKNNWEAERQKKKENFPHV